MPAYTAAERKDEYEPVTEDECQEMREACEVGWSVASLADAYQLARATVHHHLDDHCRHY